MQHKIEAVTTKDGNILVFKIYQRKGWKYLGYWKFMCNQSNFEVAKKLVSNLNLVNRGDAGV